MDFAGAHMLVTGASTGIGFATARRLARHGARVSMLARSEDKLAQASAAIVGEGGAARAFPADVGERRGLLDAVASAEAAFGPVAGLFANAGSGGGFHPLQNYPDDLFDAVVRTNLTGTFWLVKHVLPAMIAAGRGSIVLTGSLASERGIPNNIAYVASKHAVLGLARSIAVEGAPHNVRANCLLPGLIETPMLLDIDPGAEPQAIANMLGKNVPMGRIGSAEECAALAAFLLSDAASHITAQSIAVDGGILGTLIPG